MSAEFEAELLKAKIRLGCEQLDRGEYSKLSVQDVMKKAKKIRAKKIQSFPLS